MNVEIASTRFSEGDQIGPYALLRQLGRGSMGEVWLADRASEIARTRLAIKLPIYGIAGLDDVRREAQLWIEAGNHPNVLPLFEANVYDGQIVLVSEYAPDGSLEAWLQRHSGPTPTPEKAVAMVRGLLAGLCHLHGRSIVHRDLKPSNILLQDETPRLADFGLARSLTLDGLTCRVAGTPFYMAPEAFDGMRSVQTDLWSIGILFHQLLTGQLPFAEREVMPFIQSVRTRSPAPLPRSVPARIQAVIQRALEKDPLRRYSSASEMSSALRGSLLQMDVEWNSAEPPLGTVKPPQDPLQSPGERPSLVPIIEIANGPQDGTSYKLEKDRIVLGRSPDCDICLTSPAVARYHAQLVHAQEGYLIEDLQSRNGTYVQGKCVKGRLPLHDKDRIQIGGMVLIYHTCN